MTKITKNRALSLFICAFIAFVTVMLLMPAISFAEDSDFSGKCGKNVTWSFDSASGELSIDGNGQMDEFATSAEAPWYDIRNEITVVELGSDVSGVTAGAFAGCEKLEKICVAGIPEDGDLSGNYTAIDGVLFNADVTTLICYPEGKQDARYRVPESVKKIDNLAFDLCGNVQYISLPEGLKAIGNDAFANCKSLVKINVPDSVSNIGIGIFYGCENLKLVAAGEGLDCVGADMFRENYSMTQALVPENAVAIGEMAYARDMSLKQITIPSGVTSIEKDAFAECKSLKDVYFTGTKADWEEISISGGNDALKKAKIHCNADYPANIYENVYEDLDSSMWFFEAVTFVLDKNIMIGTSDTVFGPNDNLSRAALVQLLYNYEGQPKTAYRSIFTDVERDSWFADAVMWASSNGIVNGVSDNEFAPNSTLTREQFATILMRYSSSHGRDTSKSSSISGFSDAKAVSPWALTAVQWAVGEGLISGFEDGTLQPGNSATRAQAATIIKKYLTAGTSPADYPTGDADISISEIKGLGFIHPVVGILENQSKDSELVASSKVKMESSDEGIVKVNSDATITGINAGTTVVSASEKGSEAKCIVIVKDASIKSITLDESAAVKLGQTKTLNLKVTPAYADVNVHWSSSDSSVASVDDGVITPHKPGKTVITASTGSLSAACSVSVTYEDVDESSAFVNDINWAVSEGVISTLSDTKFGPEYYVSKAQMADYIWKMNGSPSVDGSNNPFSDISADNPLYNGVMFAYKNGLVGAKSEGVFGPDDAITRGDAIRMMWNCQKQRVNFYGGFDDIAKTSVYYYPARWALANGVADGVFNATVKPGAYLTKAEAARLLHNTDGKNLITYDKSKWQIIYPKAELVLDSVGHTLIAAFNWSAAMPYYGHNQYMPDTPAPGIKWYADYGFDNHKGNCYVMAATFYEMAVNLGYNPQQMTGKVPMRAGGLGPHSWVYMNVGGSNYVFDPDFQHESKRNGYMINYGQSGTWRYQDYYAMGL